MKSDKIVLKLVFGIIGYVALVSTTILLQGKLPWLQSILVFASAVYLLVSLKWLSVRFYKPEQQTRQNKLIWILIVLVVVIGGLALIVRVKSAGL
jgi:hypothetical protein